MCSSGHACIFFGNSTSVISTAPQIMCYVPFYNIEHKSQVSPEYVCEVSAQNTPHIIYYIILKMPIWV